jgi:hypothetical protein
LKPPIHTDGHGLIRINTKTQSHGDTKKTFFTCKTVQKWCCVKLGKMAEFASLFIYTVFLILGKKKCKESASPLKNCLVRSGEDFSTKALFS